MLSLRWRHNGRDSVSNHQPHDCLLNRLFSADQRKHQSSASLAFVRGIHRGPVNSPHKWPVTRKMFPFDNAIMIHDCVWTAGIWWFQYLEYKDYLLFNSMQGYIYMHQLPIPILSPITILAPIMTLRLYGVRPISEQTAVNCEPNTINCVKKWIQKYRLRNGGHIGSVALRSCHRIWRSRSSIIENTDQW